MASASSLCARAGSLPIPGRFGFRPSDWRVILIAVPKYTKANIRFLNELLAAGSYRAVIDRTYPLEDVAEATRYVENEQKTANVVLTVSSQAGESDQGRLALLVA